MCAKKPLFVIECFVTLVIFTPWQTGFAQRHSAARPYDHPRLSVELSKQPDSTLIKQATKIAQEIVNPTEVILHVFQADFGPFYVDFVSKFIPIDSSSFTLTTLHAKWYKAHRDDRVFDIKAAHAKPAHHENSSKDAPRIIYYTIKTSPPLYQTLYLSSGTFQITADRGGELPPRNIKIDSLCIGRNEVTNLQFWKFLSVKKPTPKEIKEWFNWKDRFSRIKLLRDGRWVLEDSAKYANHPVVNVTWHGAKAFCAWLGDIYSLPTENEWLFAAMSGLSSRSRQPIPQDTLIGEGNFDGISDKDNWEMTAPVDSLEQNAAGLFHFAGNVREWCEDSYQDEFKGDKPSAPSKPGLHVVRGGSWVLASKYARLNFRDGMHQDSSAFDIGFRVVIDHSK